MSETDAAVRILYVDDDPGLARLAEKGLARHGFIAVSAGDITTALARLGEEPFDALVLDHYLGNEIGLDLLHRLKEDARTLPVVYVTGSSEAQVAVDAMKAGASDYVVKTASDDFIPQLVKALRQSIEKAALLNAKEEAEREIRIAKERAEALLAEVNHRVGNSLTLAAALIRLQSQNTTNEEVRVALLETQARIRAIAGLHRHLYTSDDVKQVDARAYITMLIGELSDAIQTQGGGITVEHEIEAVQLPTDKAVSIGVIVSELITNASKYAFPDGVGQIRVELRSIDGTRALLTVSDDGIGWHGTGEVRGTGLGRKIMAAMATNLNTTLEYRTPEKGTLAELEIPLEPLRD